MVAEQPRVQDSTGETRARSNSPPPPLSRYVRSAKQTAAGTAQEVVESLQPEVVESLQPEVVESLQPEVVESLQPEVAKSLQPEVAESLQPEVVESLQPEPVESPPPEVVESLPPELQDEATTTTREASATALVTVASEPVGESSRRGKVPFWKRITLPRPIAAVVAGPTARGQSLEPILARLNALEKQMAANQSATETHLDRFEENITRLWELEEQLAVTEVRERLALLEANQEEIADALHAVSRNVAILAIVLAIAVAATLFGVGLAL